MPFYMMVILMLVFIAVVVYFAKAAVLQFEAQADSDVMKVKFSYQDMIQKKMSLDAQKDRLRSEADRIFNLYDLTREITKTFDEQEAFQIFKDHLARQISLDDCRLIESDLKGSDKVTKFQGCDFFPLKVKRMSLGEIAYKGLSSEQAETFSILAHQFALGLRRIRLYQEVENMSITDTLTQLYTRRYLMERFEEEFARARARNLPLSFVMIDVDHFKRINDQYSHLAGDQVLREIARRLLQTVREIDIVGRYGGEEFCVILPDTDKAGAALAAERIRVAIYEHKVRAYDAHLLVGVSLGVATFPEDAMHMEELVDKADWALYRAKKSGRNRVVSFSIYNQ